MRYILFGLFAAILTATPATAASIFGGGGGYYPATCSNEECINVKDLTVTGSLDVTGAELQGFSIGASQISGTIPVTQLSEPIFRTDGNFLKRNIRNLKDINIAKNAKIKISKIKNLKKRLNEDIEWSRINFAGSNLADIETRSAGDLSSGNLGVARMPLGGNWDITSNLNIEDDTLVIQSGSNVGFGTADPDERIHVSSADSDIHLQTFDTGSSEASTIQIDYYQGSTGGIPNSGHRLGKLDFAGWDGNSFEEAAQIGIRVDGDAGADDMPGRIEFETSADGTADPEVKMVIKNDGHVGIGTESPDAKLTIQGDWYDTDHLRVEPYPVQPDSYYFKLASKLEYADHIDYKFVIRDVSGGSEKVAQYFDANSGNVGFGGIDPLSGANRPAKTVSVQGNLGIGDSSYWTTSDPGTGIAVQGDVGIGTPSPDSKLEVTGGDIYITDIGDKLIMKSADGSCHACGPNDFNAWICSTVTCP